MNTNMNVEDPVVPETYGYPSGDIMVKMVNEDLLPFFETYFHYENMSVVPVERVIEITYSDIIFLREDGVKLAVWESYFKNPVEWKTNRLKLKETLITR